MMIRAAKARSYQYVAITDHSVGRGVANGLTLERLKEHIAELRRLEAEIGGIKVLCGSEVDIRADGTMDYPDEVLAELDWVIGSVHSAMGRDSETVTARVIRAMHNPYVTVIGHLSTRLIGERRPLNADYEAIFRAAAETGTAMEINASPERLDIKDAHIYRCRDLGVRMVISSDAHTTERLDNQRYGIGIARRGWCEAKDILNTLPVDDFKSFLKIPKSQRARGVGSHA
ncbi:MAG: PHP domain-containing protein [SAR202 cluster bacterium]|nr:PHP domain-containing protein [SAR202 cluster bacterium]